MNASRLVPGLAAGLLLFAAGCTAAEPPTGSPAFTLVAFDSCDQAAAQLRAAASASVGPYGFGGGVIATDGDMLRAGAAEAGAAAAQPDAAAPPAHSGTNVHESGVDEPDLVETDGRRIVTVAEGVLRVIDAESKVESGRLDLRDQQTADYWQPANLLLSGDRLLVLFQGGWYEPMPLIEEDASAPRSPSPVAGPRVLLVDLAGAPRVLSEYTVDGMLVDARAVDGTARVVVRSAPRLEFPQPGGQADEARMLEANRAVIRAAEVSDWLPRYQVTTAGQTDTGQVSCTALSHPETTYSGSSMLTVLSFDLAAPALGDGSPVSVVADGDTVYSNGTSLYISSDQRWRAEVAEERTEIYKFDIADPGPPTYLAAGSVPGWLINQYAMNEWDSNLRIATTTTQPAESAVYVLSERDGELVRTGSVGGLGETEQIHSVRFLGSVGYVVTFRQTDPLYTLDLSDPAAPALLGELEITGYSSYLHPLGDGRLIGVGQEADEQGVVLGTQVSLFDVTDLASPTRLGQHHVESGSSEAEFDPHAFLYWPDQRLLVIPLSTYDYEGTDPPRFGALLLRVEQAGFTEIGTVTHPTQDPWDGRHQIRRSLVIGDTLWTVSDLGIQASALATLTPIAWLPYSR
jgi:uncharacterized secreted protein with C-terminal beta-propeller domain